MSPRQKKAAGRAMLWLTLVAAGQEIRAQVYADGPIGGAVDFANMKVGRPVIDANGEPPLVRDMSGNVLAPWKAIPAELGLKDGAVLYVDYGA